MGLTARGAALLTVMVVVAVLAFLVAAALVFTGRETASAAQHRRREVMAACAAGARSFVLAQLRSGAAGRQANPNISGELIAGDLRIRSGHLDEYPDAGVYPLAVTVVPSGSATATTTDLTNTTPGPGSGSGVGQTYRVVTHCTDTVTGDSTEVEFQISQAL